MEITHLGHACLLVESSGARVLIDPGNFSDVSALRDLTAVVVTHQHPDHCDPAQVPALIRDNPGARLLVEPQTAEVLTSAGLADRTERLTTDETVDLSGISVRTVGAQHAVIHEFIERIGNRGVVVSTHDGPTLFHPGDALDADPGPVDLLCVPVNAPWAKVSETVEFVRRIGPARGVIPIHDGLVTEPGRDIYLRHIVGFGADGGVELHDLRGSGPTSV
ncbi:MBL fold metallo-hydrolase [Ornithinimicrobium tianjinense]|uniref:Zn-dependent hydrolase n=1 Tax=Ornithinimicrobium tianjinense TaxID=1195761 RepID=A0A917BM04_9MICO|nr:MBL fold metallo-hydrolase [Ornithinimicrobium tianjinense]GGF48914.1 Zn-dependent hydrolase [Ornithinimicrobium tianjinense]